MGYKRFTGTGKCHNPKISINRMGMLGLNDAARQKFEIDKYKFCVLFYDEDERKIGLQLTNKAQLGAIRIRRRSVGAAIGAKSFFHYFAILPDVNTRYEAKLEGDMIVICLNEGKRRRVFKV